jgi:hypothetical protein
MPKLILLLLKVKKKAVYLLTAAKAGNKKKNARLHKQPKDERNATQQCPIPILGLYHTSS